MTQGTPSWLSPRICLEEHFDKEGGGDPPCYSGSSVAELQTLSFGLICSPLCLVGG